MVDDSQRLHFFENAVRGLLTVGNREQATILGFSLAESMNRGNRLRDSSCKAVQQTLFRLSTRMFPESPAAAQSLGYELE